MLLDYILKCSCKHIQHRFFYFLFSYYFLDNFPLETFHYIITNLFLLAQPDSSHLVQFVVNNCLKWCNRRTSDVQTSAHYPWLGLQGLVSKGRLAAFNRGGGMGRLRMPLNVLQTPPAEEKKPGNTIVLKLCWIELHKNMHTEQFSV